MKKKIKRKIERALVKITEATQLLSDADDEIFYEDRQMVSSNMSIQDTVKYLFKESYALECNISATLNAINKEMEG